MCIVPSFLIILQQHCNRTGLWLGHCNTLITLFFRFSSVDLLLLRVIMLMHDTFSCRIISYTDFLLCCFTAKQAQIWSPALPCVIVCVRVQCSPTVDALWPLFTLVPWLLWLSHIQLHSCLEKRKLLLVFFLMQRRSCCVVSVRSWALIRAR